RVFDSVALDLVAEAVDAYRRATGDEVTPDGLAPPAAIVAFSLQPLLDDLGLLERIVHTGQEIEMQRAVAVGERLTATLRVVNSSQRAGATFVVIEQEIRDGAGSLVMRGRSNVVVAPAGQPAP
ncbi:MAG: hypothetical protein GEU28_12670, partial [Dehalococcoidia bacterium]|nr:hypothetical protein [Dehalococcoidia bacterium]